MEDGSTQEGQWGFSGVGEGLCLRGGGVLMWTSGQEGLECSPSPKELKCLWESWGGLFWAQGQL